MAFLTDVSGGRIRMTRIRLIVGLITPHRTYLTITKTCKGRPRPDPGCSATDDDDDDERGIGSSEETLVIVTISTWYSYDTQKIVECPHHRQRHSVKVLSRLLPVPASVV
jgi:hypothetical protein